MMMFRLNYTPTEEPLLPEEGGIFQKFEEELEINDFPQQVGFFIPVRMVFIKGLVKEKVWRESVLVKTTNRWGQNLSANWFPFFRSFVKMVFICSGLMDLVYEVLISRIVFLSFSFLSGNWWSTC